MKFLASVIVGLLFVNSGVKCNLLESTGLDVKSITEATEGVKESTESQARDEVKEIVQSVERSQDLLESEVVGESAAAAAVLKQRFSELSEERKTELREEMEKGERALDELTQVFQSSDEVTVEKVKEKMEQELQREITDVEAKALKYKAKADRELQELDACNSVLELAEDEADFEQVKLQFKKKESECKTKLIDDLRTRLSDESEVVEEVIKEEIRRTKKEVKEVRRKVAFEESVECASKADDETDADKIMEIRSLCKEELKLKLMGDDEGTDEGFLEKEKAQAKRDLALDIILVGDKSDENMVKDTMSQAEGKLLESGVKEEFIPRIIEDSKGKLLGTTFQACYKEEKDKLLQEGQWTDAEKTRIRSTCHQESFAEYEKLAGDKDVKEEVMERKLLKAAGEQAVEQGEACLEFLADGDGERSKCYEEAQAAFEEAGGEDNGFLAATEETKLAQIPRVFAGILNEKLVEGATDEQKAAARAEAKELTKEAFTKEDGALGGSESQWEDQKDEIEKRINNADKKTVLQEKEGKKMLLARVQLEEVSDAGDTAADGKTRVTEAQVKEGVQSTFGSELAEDGVTAVYKDKYGGLNLKVELNCDDSCDKSEVKDAEVGKVSEILANKEFEMDDKIYSIVSEGEGSSGRRLLQDGSADVESSPSYTEECEGDACNQSAEQNTISDAEEHEEEHEEEHDGHDHDEFSAGMVSTPGAVMFGVAAILLAH